MNKLSKIQYNSPVVLTFFLISLTSLILGEITSGASTRALFMIYPSSMRDPLFYIRIFAYIFGHGSFDHFFGNMLMLLVLGPLLEEKYGSKIIAAMIAFTALVTGFIFLALGTAALGASGIVFMFIILSGFVNMRSGRIPLTLILCVVLFLGREVIHSVTIVSNTSHAGHIIGGICGSFVGFYANRRKNLS